MKLIVLTVLAFASSAHAVVINCNFVMKQWTFVDGSIYACVGSISYYGNRDILEDIEGIHSSDRSNSDVESIELTNTLLDLIPLNLSAFLPNLKVMDFTSSQIAIISASDLQPYPELLHFRVWRNFIVSIDGDLFKYNLKLRYIDFDLNRLQNVGHNLIGGLRWLQVAEFNNNPCISRSAGTPEELSNLNLLLPVSCPPLATTPQTTTQATRTTTPFPENCSLRCTLGDEIDSLRNDLAKVDDKVLSHDQSIEKLIAQVAELTVNNLKLSSIFEELQSDNGNLRNLIMINANTVELLNGEVSELRKTNTEQNENILALTNLSIQQSSEMSKMSAEIKEMQLKMSEKDQTIRNFEDRLVETEKKLRELTGSPNTRY